MSTEEWKKENTVQYHFRVAKSTGIPEALKNMTAKTGETELAYIRRATIEALMRDGFIQIKDK